MSTRGYHCKDRVQGHAAKCCTDEFTAYRLNEPNGVPWTSNATVHGVLIWMQAKLSCLDIRSNVVCYVHLDASQIELVGRPEQRSMLRSFGRKPN